MSGVKSIAVQDNILCKKNVIRITEGTKRVGGNDTEEPCIVVEVTGKESIDQLDSHDLIPSILSDGKTKTDVIVGDIIHALDRCPTNNGSPPTGNCTHHNDTFNNCIQGGTVISPHAQTWVGTLGGIARDLTDDNLVGITNAHVSGLCYDITAGYDWGSNPNGYAIQGGCPPPMPGTYGHTGVIIEQGSGANPVPLGHVKRTVPIRFNSPGSSFHANYVDASSFTLDALPKSNIMPLPIPYDSKPLGPAANTAPIFDFNDLGDINAQNICVKIGRTTGRTPLLGDYEYIQGHDAVITDTDSAITVSYNSCMAFPEPAWYAPFINVLEVAFSTCPAGANYVFSNSGDSGSICYIWSPSRCRWEILGLVFAGTSPENKCDWRTYVCRMDYVLKELQIGEDWTPDNNYELGDSTTLSQLISADHLTVLPDASNATSLWDGSVILSQNHFNNIGPGAPPSTISMQVGPSGDHLPSSDYYSGSVGLSYQLALTGITGKEITFYEDVPGLRWYDYTSSPVPFLNNGAGKDTFYIDWVYIPGKGNVFTVNGIPNPEISLPKNTAIKFILDQSVQATGPHPFQIIDSTTSYPLSGPWYSQTADFITPPLPSAPNIPIDNKLKYICTIHGTGMGNDILLEKCQ
jgi:hypothetical protein